MLHIYTGNGKGKTTAAFGLAVRALCAGKNVYIGQFVKDMKYSETKLTEKFSNLTIEQLGTGCFMDREPNENDIAAARKGLNRCKELLVGGEYQMLILDEVTIAIHYGLLSSMDVIDAIKCASPDIEVVLTGRYATQELINAADLVTEMKEVKHYYQNGTAAREGVEY